MRFPIAAPWRRRLAEAALAAVVWALLNRAAAMFEIRPGLSFFYPAAAITVAAGARLGLTGAVAMLVANFIAPWGASVGALRSLLFALPAAIWAAVVAASCAPAGPTRERMRRVIVWGIGTGSLAAAVCGAGLLTFLVGPPTWASFGSNLAGWWIPDLATALSVGLALVAVITPRALLGPEDERSWREWAASGTEVGLVAAVVVGGVAAALLLGQLSEAAVYWVVVLLMPALLLAGQRGGIGAALVTNAAVSVLYVGTITLGHLSTTGDIAERFASAYGGLGALTAFALLSGTTGGRNRELLRLVREQGRLMAEGLEDTVAALAAAIGAKEEGSDGHVQRVARLAELVGRELGCDARELEVLRRAAILHDIGKIGVPETILNKPAGLTREERAVMLRSIELGAEIVDRVDFLKPVLDVVRYQKERWDGDVAARFGGRYGRRGDEIPLGARILGAVEAFDAMTHDRPYRKALPREAAVAELWRCSGGQFDPRVVAALTRVLREEWDVASVVGTTR